MQVGVTVTRKQTFGECPFRKYTWCQKATPVTQKKALSQESYPFKVFLGWQSNCRALFFSIEIVLPKLFYKKIFLSPYSSDQLFNKIGHPLFQKIKVIHSLQSILLCHLYTGFISSNVSTFLPFVVKDTMFIKNKHLINNSPVILLAIKHQSY